MKKPRYKKYPDEIKSSLRSIVDQFQREERATRERQIRLWKKLEYYWNGFQRVWWDDVAHDWRVWNDDVNDNLTLNEAAYYDKPMNIFRAFLETYIAALSVSVPKLVGMPDDADNPLDISTARAVEKIIELCYKHNDAQLLWCKALFVYCTQGMIAAYNYSDTDESYGLAEVDEEEEFEDEIEESICPNCKMELIPEQKEIEEFIHLQDSDEYDPNQNDVMRNDLENKGVLCINCQQIVNPEIQKQTIIGTRLVGRTKEAKTRQKIEVLGGLYVRVPNYARTQRDTPYLSYCYETHYTKIIKKYPHLSGETSLLSNANITAASQGSGYEMYERWGRLNPQYLNEFPLNTPTVRNWWLRPEAFEFENDEDVKARLYKYFPNGCKVVFINDIWAEACNESLDDHWTLTYNPLSEHLTFDPLGQLVTSVQDIINDLTSLTLQTIEHGIPIIFADPSALNMDQFSKTEATPGHIYPAKPKSGQDLGKSFHTLQTASLSKDVEVFAEKVQSQGEFISGAVPSLFGGSQGSGVRTASQQVQNTNQALQRLQITWKMVNAWWKNTFGKVAPAYIKTMLEDERIVRKHNNTYINDNITRAELQGKLGSIELEGAENLPQTWQQIRDIVLQLIETQNPEILAAISAPENLETLRSVIGLSQFDIPGNDSRQKQYQEINELIQTGPMEGGVDPMTGQPMFIPSIMPEFEVDDHMVEAAICQHWLRSEAGQNAKANNKAGYDNVVAHLKIHIQMQQQIQMESMAPDNSSANNPKEGPAADNKLKGN